jgi:two-component system OmpR family response regulator
MKILLVEDDLETAATVVAGFQERSYGVDHAADGSVGLELARGRDYDVIVLDRMLPSLDGISLVQRLRSDGVLTPVIYLTAMSGIDDRVRGLEAGGDDYLVKPFAFAELLARVRVLARRPEIAKANATRLRAGAIEIDLLARSVTGAGEPVELLPQEFRLLAYLMRHADRVVTRKMLLENVWNLHFDPQTSIVESHISRLRTKLRTVLKEEYIHTIRGMGYRFLASH